MVCICHRKQRWDHSQDWLGRPKKLSGSKSNRESSNKHRGDTWDALATHVAPHTVCLWMASGGYRPGQAEGRGHLTVLSWGHCVPGPSPPALAGDARLVLFLCPVMASSGSLQEGMLSAL